jgi:phosphoenolpyruvate synthase/pyruvate phosphate dikinase
MTWTLHLDELGGPDSRDVTRAGGKAVGLARLRHFGFRVPDGFVVTGDVYRRAVTTHGIVEEIRRLQDQRDLDERAATARRIRHRLHRTVLPRDVASEIHRAVGELDPSSIGVAVRSSATVEDGTQMSFAGQFLTTLAVQPGAALETAVRRCWASLFSPEATAYLAASGCRLDELVMAVVVQRLVRARAAGVMMTVDPRTGDRSQIVVEGSIGLGLPLVSGQINPDRFCVDKVTLTLRSRAVGDKRFALAVAEGRSGIVRRRSAEVERRRPCIDDDDALAVACLGRDVERAFKAPQDIEWAFGRDGSEVGLFALQTRPLTALPNQVSAAADAPSA